MGRGLWHSEFDSYPDPAVTRFAGSATVFIRSRHDVRPYVGLGLAAYVPRAKDLQRARVDTDLLFAGRIGIAIRRGF